MALIEAEQALAAIGVLPDTEIEPGMAALQLARLDQPELDALPAAEHLSQLAREAAAIGAVMQDRSNEARAGALTALLHAAHRYRGDTDTYDDLANANLIQVIARRRGLPVALGLLWLHCSRAAGWEAHGIDFPGHFLVSLRLGGQGLLIDPFGLGSPIGDARLLGMLRAMRLPQQDLQPGMTRPMNTRDVLLRLQRNLVQRRLQAGDIQAALASLRGMLLIAPDIPGNWLDAAELNRLLGETQAAVLCLERVVEMAPLSPAADLARKRLAALR